MAWYQPDDIREHRQRLVDYPERLHHVQIVHLANDLEDRLDLAMAGTVTTRLQRRIKAHAGDIIALVHQSSLRRMAEGLQACSETQRSKLCPTFSVVEHCRGYEPSNRRLWQASPLERISVKGVRLLNCLRKHF